jgi:hypothetical protein
MQKTRLSADELHDQCANVVLLHNSCEMLALPDRLPKLDVDDDI